MFLIIDSFVMLILLLLVYVLWSQIINPILNGLPVFWILTSTGRRLVKAERKREKEKLEVEFEKLDIKSQKSKRNIK